MYIEWTKHLHTEDEKKRFRDSIYGSRFVLNRLKSILEEYERVIAQEELSEDVFKNAGWVFKQASNIGERKALNKLKKLIDLDVQKVTPQGDNT